MRLPCKSLTSHSKTWEPLYVKIVKGSYFRDINVQFGMIMDNFCNKNTVCLKMFWLKSMLANQRSINDKHGRVYMSQHNLIPFEHFASWDDHIQQTWIPQLVTRHYMS